jgi:hypothetical protein
LEARNDVPIRLHDKFYFQAPLFASRSRIDSREHSIATYLIRGTRAEAQRIGKMITDHAKVEVTGDFVTRESVEYELVLNHYMFTECDPCL